MLSQRARFWLAVSVMVSLLAFGLACKKKDVDDEGPDVTENTGTPYKSKGDEGTITGKVALNGSAPAAKPIDMSQDGACVQSNPNPVSEELTAKDGKLASVFVYIKDGQVNGGKKIKDYTFDVPAEAATLDQHGCHYVPHVLGLMAKQKVNVVNSDPTTHNVNVQAKSNEKWNQSQTQGAAPIVKTFARAEQLIPVKCNQHPWMKAYINVLSHPYFAVTKEDGTFEIKGVPPGTYTLVAWHEKLGEKTAQVKVDAKGTVTTDFAYDAGATASLEDSSLKLMPALDIPMMMRH
jgi:plastocyanin